MRLFIAEKPSAAKAIAAQLGSARTVDSALQCADATVTWCFGHMLEQAQPDAYTPDDVPTTAKGKKVWRVDELPIVPGSWKMVVRRDASKQLSVIGKLLKGATEVVNAGDPDREGQLLVDEVLEHFKYRGPVRRFWVSAQDATSIARGLSDLRDNAQFVAMGHAARARQRADWLVGMNLSRAYTLRAQRGGSRALLTVGRVQTPTLSLVVARDAAIENFTAKPYYVVKALVEHAGGRFVATYKPADEQEGLDEEGRLADRSAADALESQLQGHRGEVTLYKQTKKAQPPPPCFSLSDITVLASQKFGYSAAEVLTACQALYETHKLTSYPRTDCGYLPEAQHADAPAVLAALQAVNPDLGAALRGADASLKSPTWNDKKVTAHHGIVPTMHKGDRSKLKEPERRIYALIASRYVAQFYPDHAYLETKVALAIEGHALVASGRLVTREGWRSVAKPEKTEAGSGQAEDSSPTPGEQAIPKMAMGDAVRCIEATRHDAKTKPPARFTEGTLIRAMEQVHKFVQDKEFKKLLREGDGIGTSATRAQILAELKRREFLETQGKKGKHLVSTSLGRQLIAALPEAVCSAALTALYERRLSAIEAGKMELGAFVQEQADFVTKRVTEANAGSVTIDGGGAAARGGRGRRAGTAKPSAKYMCRACGKPLARRPSTVTKRAKSYWWGCTGFPTCKQTYPDRNKRPNYPSPSTDKDTDHV